MAATQRPTRRRAPLALPRRWPHLAGAAALLCLVLIVAPWLAIYAGDARDALAGGSVGVAALPASQRPSPLDEAQNLPDLLAADVLMGDNPTLGDASPATARVDALGNPAVTAPSAKTVELPQRAATALAPLDPALTRQSPFGTLPGPAPDGRTPLQAYRRPASLPGDRRGVAIVVGGLGVDAALTQRAIAELPAEVTLSFAAHAPDLQAQIDLAREAGHEVLLEIPMESDGFNAGEPGAARALRAGVGAQSNRQNLQRVLAQARGYAGVINYNGNLVLTRADLATPILEEIGRSGLSLFADGSFDTPTLPALAGSLDVPFVRAFGLIDPAPDRTMIDARLSELSRAAASDRVPVGVGFAYPQTIDALKGWASTLSSEGRVLVPATAALP